MKQFIQISTIIICILCGDGCRAQYMMQTLNDAQKIKANEKQFIGKPLKDLLKEIKPPIKRVSGNPSASNQVRLGYLRFAFDDPKSYDSISSTGKYPLTITVFVKEPFKWSMHDRPEKNKLIWTKEDAERLKDLTVLGIRVFGEN